MEEQINVRNHEAKCSRITVDPSGTFQTMVDISGNFCQATYTQHASDEVGDFMLDNLKPTHVRVPIPVKYWEPVNRKNDGLIGQGDSAESIGNNGGRIASKGNINWDNFCDTGVINELFLMLKDMKENRGVTNITASIWDLPDWMVSNPESGNKRVIPQALYERVSRSIAAFLIRAKDEYGVEIDYFSFNESNGGYQIYFTPQTMIDFIKITGPIFDSCGLKTIFLTGDTYSTHSLVEFALPQLQEDSIRKYLGPIAYHSWWSEDKPDTIFSDIAELSLKYGLPVWCNELGYDAMLYHITDRNPYETWDNALRLAKVQYRVLKFSRAEVTQYWTFQRNFSLISREGKPYPAYYVIKHTADALPAGSQIISANSDNPDLLCFAAKGDNGHFMIQIINTASAPVDVVLNGLPDISLKLARVASGGVDEDAGRYYAKNGDMRLTLLGESVNTFSAV